MARPRWHDVLPQPSSRIGLLWDRFVAIWAVVNLVCVAFDITYVPLRTFWLQRHLPIPTLPVALPITELPDITPWVDPIKGIEPHRETQTYQQRF